ncbi:LytTR family DNA-binding domain-containing protein [Pedobacter endophyticus]|uniref:LytTR family transcriptional regulator n=1 Tax=Pedobacter endophyticus TaxID=2789740 RepID=A0A7S9L0C7_9SPHI|nr:LytTR family DNA-binding domain-containing protein [Pedobacter endophyticus]QPH40156.1 LytTR family transcriptional regulator [Pedobacter endophyticus]
MRRLIKLLNETHPAHDNPVGYLKTITIIGIVLFAILWVFKPFNFHHLQEDRIFVMALLYAGTAYVTMLICLIWIIAFPRIFEAKTWTLGKELLIICYQFTTIAFTVWLLTRYLGGWKPGGQSYWTTWFMVAKGGILPYFVATSIKHVYLLKKHVKDAELMQQQVTEHKASVAEQRLHIPHLLPPVNFNEFLFAESDGNYLKIHVSRSNTLLNYTVRLTLKQFEADNSSFTNLFRCHRMFLINLAHINQIAGNAAGYLVTLGDDLTQIPVSRAKVPLLKTKLAEPSE